LKKNITISEEVEVVWVVLWSWELWLDRFNEIIVVLTVDHEIEHWLEITFANGHEVDVDQMPDVKHDWGVSWVHPLLVLLGKVKALDGGLDESTLVRYNNLVLVLLGDSLPMVLHGLELVGIDKILDGFSDGDDLWHLVLDVVLHLSEFVVLLVEDDPLIVVDVDLGSVVWGLTGNLHVGMGGSLELHVSHLDLMLLSHVNGLDLLHLLSWALLLDGLDELGESDELLGVDESLTLILELCTMGGVLHLHLVFLALSLESFTVLLKTLNFLLLEVDGEEFSGLLILID